MKPLSSVRRAEAYYAVSDAGYYSDAERLHREWGGKGAERLGLDRDPDYEQFKRLLRGLDPQSGERLTAKLVADRIAALDVTLSVPKRVTLALEFGDERIGDAIRDAAREAMAELQKYATTRVRAGRRQEDRRTGELLWYMVEHAETRPTVDPNFPEGHRWREMPCPDRHLHCVVPNLTFDAVEEKWKAVKFRPIMDLRRYLDRTFDAILADKLVDLGYEVETTFKDDGRYHTWDIQGISDEIAERFSRRSREVEAAEAQILSKMREEHGSAPDALSAVARDKLGATSREVKRDDLTLAECREYWRACLSDDEFDSISETIARARGNRDGERRDGSDAAIAFALKHHSEMSSAFRWEDLAATALERGMGSASPAGVRLAAERRGVIFREKNGREMCTTEELRREEDRIVGFAAGGKGKLARLVVPKELDRGHLSSEQWRIVRGLLTSRDRVGVIDAAAGTGKTTLLKTYREGMRLAGRNVTFLGTTSDSVDILAKDGFDAKTAAHFLLSDKAKEAARGGWVVLDEASMLGHKQAYQLTETARKYDLKLLFVGDSRQHRSVNRGDFLRLMRVHAGVRPFTLTEIRRQKDNPDYLRAVKLLSAGKSRDGFDALDQEGCVVEIGDDRERIDAVADEYVKALEDKASAIVVCPTHGESETIVSEIRRRLRESGRISGEERTFMRLAPVHATEAMRELRSAYRDGDVLEFVQNAKGGYTKGARLVVRGPASIPTALAERFRLFRPEPITVAAGDLIRFTSTVRTRSGKTLRNGAVHAVSGFTDDGGIRLSNGETVGSDVGHFRQGFVDTTFSSQGKTTRRAILAMGSRSLPAIDMEALYVGASRARDSIRLYTDDREAVREASSRREERVLASDLASSDEARARIERNASRLRRLAEWARRVEEIVRDRIGGILQGRHEVRHERRR